jgi:hypothetical protein
MPIICPPEVPTGASMTKESRHDLFGAVAGGAGSSGPEKYQRAKLAEGMDMPCVKTNLRINKRTHTIHELAHPMKQDDGFDYTENFDGAQVIAGRAVLYNLKCVVGTGGSQTRTLRDECAPFVEAQLQYLLAHPEDTTLFVNAFDGDEAARTLPKFTRLLALPEYAAVAPRVYVGDLQGAFAWVAAQLPEGS